MHRTNKSNQQEDKSGSKQVSENPKTYVIVLETGDEVLASLNGFARAEHLAASSFKAIGALSSVELGWFNWDSKEYQIAVKLDERGRTPVTGGCGRLAGGLLASWVMNEFMAGPGQELQQALQSDDDNQQQQTTSDEPKDDAAMKAADAVVLFAARCRAKSRAFEIFHLI